MQRGKLVRLFQLHYADQHGDAVARIRLKKGTIVWALIGSLSFGLLASYGCSRAEDYLYRMIGAACWSALTQFEQMKADMSLLMPVTEWERM